MAAGSTDVAALQLQVDASVELARLELQKLTGDVNRFATNAGIGLGKVDKSLSTMGSSLSAAGGLFKGFIGGFLGTAGIGVLVEGSRAILQFADDLDAAAGQAGVGVERYQTLREGLRALEVDTEQTDKILRQLTATLGAVQSGTAAKGVSDALDRMGVKAKILSGEITTTDGLFDAIAKSAGRFKTQAEFVSAVVDVVGQKLGVQLAGALKDSGAALAEQEQAFRDTGTVITEEYVTKLADANEAVDKFTTQTKSRLTIWAAEAIGYYQDVTAAVQAYADAGNSASGIGALGVAIDAAQARAAKNAKTRADQFAKERDAATIKQLPQGSVIRQQMQDQYDAKYGLPDIVITGRAKVKAVPAKTGGKDLSKNLTAAKAPASALLDIADITADRFQEVAASMTDLAAQTDAPLAAFREFQTIEIPPLIDAETEGRMQAGADLMGDISDGLAQSIIYGQNLGEALGNAFKSAGAKLLSSGILDLLNGIGGGGGAGLFGAIAGGIKSFFGGGFASGGVPPRGKISIVGENGPEPIIGNGVARVLPNSVFGGSGGRSAQQAVHVTVGVEPSPLFITSAHAVASKAGAEAAGGVIAGVRRQRIPGGRG